MKLASILCVVLLSSSLSCRRNVVGLAATSQAGEAATAELYTPGKPLVLPEPAQQELCRQAIQLLETSNFHSYPPGSQSQIFTLPKVQSDYRREVAGKFLLILFPTPQKIKTVGGEITVSEIIVGLNRNDYASNLFTVDDSGRVVGHSFYAGERCIELLNAVKRFTPDA